MGSLKCLNSPSDTYYLNTWDRARSLGFLITNNYERRVVHTVQYTTFTRFFQVGVFLSLDDDDDELGGGGGWGAGRCYYYQHYTMSTTMSIRSFELMMG